MPGRKYSVGSGYRYGFNGKEKSDEVYGDGNVYDYGFRIYNPRIAKFLSVDPLGPKYPWYTPYQFAGNKPIVAVDLDGREEFIVTTSQFKNGGKSITIEFTTVKGLKRKFINMNFKQVMGVEPDGSMILGGTWTTAKVVRIIQSEGGKEKSVTFDNSLNKDELSIINEATKDGSNGDNNIWTIQVGGVNYASEEGNRNPVTQQDMLGFKVFESAKIKKLTSEIGGGIAMDDKGTVLMDYTSDGRALKVLPSQIAADGGIAQINITLIVPYNEKTTSTETVNLLRERVFKAGQTIKRHLLKSGIEAKNIHVQTGVKAVDMNEDPTKAQGGTGTIELIRKTK